MLSKKLKTIGVAMLASIGLSLSAPAASAFCGFYVAKADTDLFNEASKVVLARDKDRTVVTMASDFEGDVSEFAMVVPVPVILEEGQINVGNPKDLAHLDAYTAPRLVEYHDPDPCNMMKMRRSEMVLMAPTASNDFATMEMEEDSLGVTIEAEYEVGEYDILILSAEQSDGLITWLNREGYKIPRKAKRVVGSYLKQDMKFFVAKVNLERHESEGSQKLRPLQMAYESEKFMLPIRLGTVNAKGDQELFLFTLNRTGRVETSNYRTVKLPSNLDIPVMVQDKFADFYRDMFTKAHEKEGGKAVFLEYAWDMNWCDPCAADPLSREQLMGLGAMWMAEEGNMGRGGKSMARNAFVTRLHVRYNATTFPEDLELMNTNDRSNYQGRYVMRHEWKGEAECEGITAYNNQLVERWDREAETLAKLTGWRVSDIKRDMKANGQHRSHLKDYVDPDKTPWWRNLWNRDG